MRCSVACTGQFDGEVVAEARAAAGDVNGVRHGLGVVDCLIVW